MRAPSSVRAVLAVDAAAPAKAGVIVQRVRGVSTDAKYTPGRRTSPALTGRSAVPGAVARLVHDVPPGPDPCVDASSEERAGTPRVGVEHHQGLGRANLDPVRPAKGVAARAVPHLEGVADVAVAVEAVSDPVDRPRVTVALIYVPVPQRVLTAVPVQIESLEEIIDEAAPAAMALLGLDLQEPVAAVVRVADADAAVGGTLPAVVDREPVSKVGAATERQRVGGRAR